MSTLKERSFDIAVAPKRNSRHWKQHTITWGEITAWLETPKNVKEAGNYLLGKLRETTTAHEPDKPCTALHRRKNAIVSRSAITLDVDHPEPEFLERIELTFPYAAIVHTTFSSKPDTPRYRLIVPTDRDMKPDEYLCAANSLVQQLGKDQFDPSTDQPERYMFKPSAAEPSWWKYVVVDGDPAPVEKLLLEFEEDLTRKPLPRPNRTKRNPLEIDGIVGAFNRAYLDWDLLIKEYELPYDKVDDERYQLIGAKSLAGMGPISEAPHFVFSHHTSDPAYGKTCSAFDLVRLHRFGDLDESSSPQTPVNKLPSTLAMLELASIDHRVLAEQVGLVFDEVDIEAILDGEDPEDTPEAWKVRLRRKTTGEPHDEAGNRAIIAECHPVFRKLRYNRMTLAIEYMGSRLPWRTEPITELTRSFNEVDRYELGELLETELRFRTSKTNLDMMVNSSGHRKPLDPAKEYLESLTWDGVSRIETCLPEVADPEDPYTRLVLRRCLVGAVARVFEPGIKWDHMLVLYGKEGLGKTTWVSKLARGWDDTLGRIDSKDTLLALQRTWIMLSDEGHSLRKSDTDALKEFITRTKDLVRRPYATDIELLPRRCVIWSTTNDATFLRNEEGNRRYLILHVEKPINLEALTDQHVGQLWAEAVHLYRAGEPLYLNREEAKLAAVRREAHVEDDIVRGYVEQHLERKYPADWDDRTPESRQDWIQTGREFEAGTLTLDRVCVAQVYVEELGGKRSDIRSTAAREVRRVLTSLPGWTELSGLHRHPQYGPQRVFERVSREGKHPELESLL